VDNLEINLKKQIRSKQDLIDYFSSGSKKKKICQIGTEHEKFLFNKITKKPIPFKGKNSVNKIFSKLKNFGWKEVKEGKNVLSLNKGKKNITLEPGLQIELSGATVRNIHETCREINYYLDELKSVCDKFNIGLLGNGFAPTLGFKDVQISPKRRYKIMRKYMPKVDKLGLDMMHRTCATQVNLDFKDEIDYKFKTNLIAKLIPISIALFSNSPFKEGKLNGYLSYRCHVWQNTDHNRSGIPKFFFEKTNSFERYVDYALNVPMYFVIRNTKYYDCTGESFRSFISGNLKKIPRIFPTLGDWQNHISTIFTELRLKKYIEIRSTDSCSFAGICSIPAFWTGILYDEKTLYSAMDFTKNWTYEDIMNAYYDVPKKGLRSMFRGKEIATFAKKILDFSYKGLKNRKIYSNKGNDETIYLNDVFNFIKLKKNPAQILIDKYKKKWNNNLLKIFDEEAY